MADLPELGATSSITMMLTTDAIDAFAAVTGDANPVHLDETFAARTRFGRRIGHGMWAGSLISAVLGTQLPGPGTIYLNQTLSFRRPVYVGDEVTATVRVQEVRTDKALVTLATECVNQDGEVVVAGEALVLLERVADA